MNFIKNFFSKYPQEKIIKWFKLICITEAITCFLLYGVAMIWKRYDDEGFLPHLFIICIGNIHGLFFVLYLLFCFPIRKIFNWDDEDFVFALLAALFPFATIWIEKKMARFDRD